MGIRRRRRRLTTLMSRLDQRVKSVELRPISLLTQDQINSAVELGEAAEGPTAVLAGDAPTFVKIQDAYIYPKKVTGTEDRVEIYLEADLGLEVGDRLHVSGIHGTQNNIVDASSDNFTVSHLDTPPWEDRTLPGSKVKDDPSEDQLPGVTISNTYSFKPETQAPTTWTNYYRLQTKRAVDTYAITGNTVTLTMNAVHKFQAGDIVYVDIFQEDSRAYGTDGLFTITSVTDTTIVYTLTAGVDTPVSATEPDNDVYVFPVAKKYLAVGSTWADSSNNKIYYWDGIRWVDYSTVANPVQDGDPPAAPTNLDIESEVTYYNTTLAVSKVSVSWTAPTLTEAGEELTDLAGYLIRWRENVGDDWRSFDQSVVNGNSVTFDGSYLFKQGTQYYFEVLAYDSGKQYSEALAETHTTSAADPGNIENLKPTPPTIAVSFGVASISWDGNMDTNPDVPAPAGATILEIHRSSLTDFTISDATLIGSISAVKGAKFASTDMTYGATYYFRFRLRTAGGQASLPSDQVSAVTSSTVDAGKIANIISAANITPGTIVTGDNIIGLTITGQLIQGMEIHGNVIEANTIEADRINVGALAAVFLSSDIISTSPTDTGSRVRVTASGIEAYNGSTSTFSVSSSDGSVYIGSGATIGGYATTGTVTAVDSKAQSAYDKANSASSTASDAYTLAGVANTAAQTATGSAANAIADISALEGKVYYPGTTQINGGNVRTGTLVADAIGAGTLVSGVIYSGSITATQVSAGTFTGSTFRTATPNNKRILVSSSSHALKAFNAGDDDLEPRGTLEGTSSGFEITGYGGSAPTLTVGSSSISTYGGTSTAPQLLLTSSGAVMYGYASSGNTNDKPRLSLATTAASIYGPNLDHGFSFFNTYSTWVSSDPRVSALSGTTTSTVSTGTDGGLYRGTGSDRSIKRDIEEIPLSSAKSIINRLNPVTYKYNYGSLTDGRTHYGVIAQDVQEALDYRDEIVFETELNGNTFLAVEYNELIPILIATVKDLSAQVEELQGRLNSLESN